MRMENQTIPKGMRGNAAKKIFSYRFWLAGINSRESELASW